MSFSVNFYQTASRTNDLNKALTALNTVECTATGEMTLDKLYLDIDFDAFNLAANYCYIDAFKRYYFVVPTIVGNLVKCELESDPLVSFKSDVLNADVIANRSSSSFNRYLKDEIGKVTPKVTTFVSRFAYTFDTSNTGNHYVLTVGGK